MTKVIKFRGKCVFTMPGNLPSKSAVLKLSPLCPFQNVTNINSCLESSTVFSRKILWRCLTFGAVYTITKPIYVFSMEGSEYIQFFASPYPSVTANRSGP